MESAVVVWYRKGGLVAPEGVLCSFCPIIIQTVSLPCSLPLQGVEGTHPLPSSLFSVPFSFTFSFFSLYCNFSCRRHFLCVYFFDVFCIISSLFFGLFLVCVSVFFSDNGIFHGCLCMGLFSAQRISAMISFPLLVQMVAAAGFILAL